MQTKFTLTDAQVYCNELFARVLHCDDEALNTLSHVAMGGNETARNMIKTIEQMDLFITQPPDGKPVRKG